MLGFGNDGRRHRILLNNRMAYWHLDRAIPNLLRPGRRVRHTMNPPLVLKEGRLWGVFGTPGADNQVQVNFQVATAMIDFGLDPQQAAEMPRWTSMRPGQYADYPHDGPDALTIEAPVPEDLRSSSPAAATRSLRSATSKGRAASRSSGVTATYSWPVPTRAATAGRWRGEQRASRLGTEKGTVTALGAA